MCYVYESPPKDLSECRDSIIHIISLSKRKFQFPPQRIKFSLLRLILFLNPRWIKSLFRDFSVLFHITIPTVGEMQTWICTQDIRNVAHREQKFTKHLKFAQLPYQARLWTLLFLHSRCAWNGCECCKQNYVNFGFKLSGRFWLLFLRFSFPYTVFLTLEVVNLRLGVSRECSYLTTLERETIFQIAHWEIERPCFSW